MRRVLPSERVMLAVKRLN